MPRHSPYALLSFNFFLPLPMSPSSASGLGSLNCLSFFLQIFGFIVCFEKTSLSFPVTFPPFGLIVIFLPFRKNLFSLLKISKIVLLSVRFTLIYFIPFSMICFRLTSVSLVGSSGLEPPTSRLSGARSNHLSYEPI